MNAAFDANGFSIPGERAGWCLDCSAVFHLPARTCPRCGAQTVVALLNFLNAITRAKEAPCSSPVSAPSSSRS